MAGAPSPRKSFYLVVFRGGDERRAWCWEIRRKRQPMGVRLWEGGFGSYGAAQSAGRITLEDFLNGLVVDTRSSAGS